MDVSLLNADLSALRDKIITIFEEVRKVRGIGSTSASKILHLLRPELFVMLDVEIAKKFQVNMNPVGYLRFLNLCQSMLKAIFEKYRERGINNPELYLVSKFGKSLTSYLMNIIGC